MVEYGATILLVAAIAGVVVASGLPGQVAQFISDAIPPSDPKGGSQSANDAGETGDGDDAGDAGDGEEEGDDDCSNWNPTCWFSGDDEGPEPVSNQEDIESALKETKSGREALEYIEEHGIGVEYVPGEGENEGTCWYSSGILSGNIEVDTTRETADAAGCAVHEVDHARADENGNQPSADDYGDDEENKYLRDMAEFEANARIAQIKFLKELRVARGADADDYSEVS